MFAHSATMKNSARILRGNSWCSGVNRDSLRTTKILRYLVAQIAGSILANTIAGLPPTNNAIDCTANSLFETEELDEPNDLNSRVIPETVLSHYRLNDV